MQIIISPLAAGQENFLVDVDAGIKVEILRAQAALKVSADPASVKLVFEGIELLDGTALSDYYIQQLSTLRLAVVPPTGAALPPAAAAAAAAPGISAGDAHAAASTDGATPVAASEIPCSVVVTGIPVRDPASTEKALFDAFSRYGHIARLLFQDEPPAAADTLPTQRAVVVYSREGAAAAALSASGSSVLGAPITVVMANNLGVDTSDAMRSMLQSGGVVHGSVSFRFFDTRGSTAVARLLAQGFLYGQEGVAHVRQYDEEHQLSQRIKVFADTVKERTGEMITRYRVMPTVQAAYERAAAQAAELNRTYRIRETVDVATQHALATAAQLAERAMANPHVARSVTAARAFIEQAAAAIDATYLRAKEEVRALQPPATAAGMPPPAFTNAAPAGEPGEEKAAAPAAAPTHTIADPAANDEEAQVPV